MQDTYLYDELLDRITGAKERIEAALLAEEQAESIKNVNDFENFDIREYLP